MLFKRRHPKDPLISVVIIGYNMARELPRTVETFLPPYQRGIDADEIEIIVMDNGSSKPVPGEIVQAWPSQVKYHYVEDAHPSPALALNQGVSMARGKWVCPAIDGARMVSPAIMQCVKALILLHDNPVIATIGYHLGSKVQHEAVLEGYDQDVEDALLASVNWRADPEKLFDISVPAASSVGLFLQPIAESNVLILKKSFYLSIGGYDEAFNIPGGALVNLDFFKRCVEHPSTDYILLANEGSFHQFHGGAATSNFDQDLWRKYAAQYEAIRGVVYAKPETLPIIYGKMTEGLQQRLIAAAKTL